MSSSSSSQLSWEETKSIVSEVEELFKLEQDLPVVREVSKLYVYIVNKYHSWIIVI